MKKCRKELKLYFQSGCRPTEEQFVDLIDSTYNIIDDDINNPTEIKQMEVAPPPPKRYLCKEFPTDGFWHNLSFMIDGTDVQLYRIVATQKSRSNGRCYICEVLASRLSDVYGEIRSTKRHLWWRSSPISFRWSSCLGILQLQIKCKPMGRLDDKVYCYIEQLWDRNM